MNHKKSFPIVFGALALALSAQAGKLDVVATTPDFGAIAREIGGDRVTVADLAKPTEDPHFVDAKPSLVVKLNHADAVIEGGAELELGWLPALLDNARNSKLDMGKPGRILGSEGISMLEVPATLDRSRGDIHAAGAAREGGERRRRHDQNFRCFTVTPRLMSCLSESMPMRTCWR